MRGHTQEKNPLLVSFVKNIFYACFKKFGMREFTQVRGLTNVSTAQKHLNVQVAKSDMRELTQRKDHKTCQYSSCDCDKNF